MCLAARLLGAACVSGVGGAAAESGVLLVEARCRPSGEDPAGLGQRPAAGDPKGLGLGQDRGDRPAGDGAPGALPGQGRPHEGGGRAGPRREVTQEGEHPGAQSRRPPGLQVRAEDGAQGPVVVAGARQPGGAGAARPGQGERRPALREAVGEPSGGLGGGHPGGAVLVEPQEPGGRGDLDDAGGGVGLQVERIGSAGQGARAHSAGAADRAALAAPLLQEGGHEPDDLLGVEGGLGGDDVGSHRLQVAGLGGGEGLAGQAAAAQGESDLARQDEAGAPVGIAAALQPAAFDERGRTRCGAAGAQGAGGRPPGEGLEHLHGGHRDDRLAASTGGVLAQLLQGGWQLLCAQGLSGPGPQAEGVWPEGGLECGQGTALDDERQPAQVLQCLGDLLSRQWEVGGDQPGQVNTVRVGRVGRMVCGTAERLAAGPTGTADPPVPDHLGNLGRPGSARPARLFGPAESHHCLGHGQRRRIQPGQGVLDAARGPRAGRQRQEGGGRRRGQVRARHQQGGDLAVRQRRQVHGEVLGGGGRAHPHQNTPPPNSRTERGGDEKADIQTGKYN